MTEQTHIPREDLTLYAMQALDSQETVAIEAHLQNCAGCRADLAESRGELALLAIATEEQPLPAGARARFMARIEASAATSPASVVSAPTPARRRRGIAAYWIPWAAAAALLVLAAGLEMKVRDLSREIARQSQAAKQEAEVNARAQRVLDLLTAPAAQHVVLTAAPAHPLPSARAVYLASNGALILQASNLAPVPGGKTYELWILPANGSAPVPAGLFRPDASGSASLVLPQLPAGVQAKGFGVTVEQATGSASPTLPIVLSGTVPAGGE